MRKPTTITLEEPVTVDGAAVTTLVMRPPRARDQRDAQRAGGSKADIEFRFLGNLCEVSPETIAELHMVDFLAVQGAYRDFTQPRPPAPGAA